ncbi:unnamed protein product, partial [Ectocarpus sp. 4 AP-2014]
VLPRLGQAAFVQQIKEKITETAPRHNVADEGQAATAGGDDDEEEEVPLDVTADMSSAEVEELLFFKVAGLAVKLDTFHAMQRVSKLILKSH